MVDSELGSLQPTKLFCTLLILVAGAVVAFGWFAEASATHTISAAIVFAGALIARSLQDLSSPGAGAPAKSAGATHSG